MAALADRPDDIRPALIASALLHAVVFGLGYVVWPNFSKPITLPASTPVTLVASAPTPDVRPAVEAPKVETAQTPEPVPQTAPEPPSPVVAPPAPTPPKPPTPKPAAQAAVTPAPTPPAPTLDLNALAKNAAKPKPRQALDLNALAAPKQSLDLAALAAGGKPRNAQRGPARAETDLQARQALGAAQGLSADEIGLLAAKLNRLWRPNCGVEGAGNVIIRVEMKLTINGALASRPVLVGQSSSGVAESVIQASAVRALSAIAQGAPYSELPRARYDSWRDVIVNFDARKACGGF